MRSIIFCVCVLVLSINALAQKQDVPSASFTISGAVKSPVTIQITDLTKWKSIPIGDVVITNHLGEKKSEVKGLKGILLKDVLGSVEITSDSPKLLSEYYFICKANDGYTVVYSWNEIFNTVVGDSVYIVTEKDGKSVKDMDGAILMISPKDFKTGRRHVKALISIEVKRA
ncbi:MAG: molybdopterin-binding protein [Cyclobacteriaceae bacterium]|nr:molybdopterin-binding protein [Cyclobacteriaceae bacterium]